MADLALTFQDRPVRTRMIGDDPCVLLVDVIAGLGLKSSPAQVAQRLPDGVQKTDPIVDRLGRTQHATWVTESGFYRVALRANTEKAEPFIEWVTAEVLPSIRETGSYQAPAVELSDDELMLKALTIASKRVEVLTARAEEAEAQIVQAAPKVELADRYLDSRPNGRLVREVAKLLGMKESGLRAFLLDERMIHLRHARCGANIYDFGAEFRPHFEAREKVVDHNFGACPHYTLYVTPRGVDLIRKRLASARAVVKP